MAKKFTVVNINNEYEILLKGYVEIKDLSLSDEVVNVLGSYSSFELVHFLVEHNLFLDLPDKNVDILQEDLEFLSENYDYFLEEGNILTEEFAEFDIYGIAEEEIVDS